MLAADSIDLDSDGEVQLQPLLELGSRSRGCREEAHVPTRRWGRCFSGAVHGAAVTAGASQRGDSASSSFDCIVVRGDDAPASDQNQFY